VDTAAYILLSPDIMPPYFAHYFEPKVGKGFYLKVQLVLIYAPTNMLMWRNHTMTWQ